jgi:hypothetical protein
LTGSVSERGETRRRAKEYDAHKKDAQTSVRTFYILHSIAVVSFLHVVEY